MKKLASLLLALVMLISCVPAMAEDGPISGVTIPTQEVNITVPSTDKHTYSVYQIFTGSLSNDVLSNVMYGQNAKIPTDKKVGDLVSADELKKLTDVNTSTSNADKLAVIKNFVDLSSEAIGTVSSAQPLTVTTGYYLIIDNGALAAGETYSVFVAEIVGPTTITAKRDTVISTKKVDDENDSVADNGDTTDVTEGEDGKDWQDSADYDIGDAVPFQLTATIPENYDDYKAFYLAFHDNQSAGLTFNKDSVKVYVDSVEITNGYEVKEPGAETDCTFEIEFINLKTISAVKANSVITVEYTSTLNDEAVIGSAGNPNEMYVEYSNNPNSDWDGKTDSDNDGTPDKPGDDETGETPEDKVIVFTYKFDVNKVTKDNAALAGAEFDLYKYDAAVEGEDKWVKLDDPTLNSADDTNTAVVAGSVFTWTGLDDGNYKLVETKAPAGYNLLTDPIYFTIEATHDVEAADPTLKTLVVKGNDGNPIDTFTVTLDSGEIDTNIVNQAGATLPETGGMGTTILYVGGGILVLAAIVLLIVKRRANAE